MLKKIIIIICGLVILYVLFNSIIADIFLRRTGKCIKAYIYTETIGTRTSADLGFRFSINNEVYKGLMPVDKVLKVGDSICIVYLESFPSVNRPLRYFESGEARCNCGK